jgi:hypothetical protein
MPDSREPQSLIDEAEQAAKTGDYARAERLLREAADLQEYGPPAQRAELANTLNNLGVVCELTDNPVEAERCFRRAYQIAVEVLEPNHPFVTTARKNLEDFCAANGKEPFPEGEPRPRPAVPSSPSPGADAVTAPPLTDLLRDLNLGPPPEPPPPPQPARAPAPQAPPVAARQTPAAQPTLPWSTSSRAMAIGLVALAVLLALFLARSLFFREPATREVAATTTSQPSDAAPATTPTPSPAPAPARSDPAPPAKPAEAISPSPRPDPKAGGKSKSAPAENPRPATTAGKGGIALATGELCSNLRTGGGEWRCEAAGTSVRAGQLYFYTRVKSATNAVVEHRWYRGDELRKSVDLTIAANPSAGYRTYSRNTVSAGDWRVELRTKNGDVLHEERIQVR